MAGVALDCGNGLGGWLESPTGSGPFPGVLVLMEAFGLTPHVRRVCQRLAGLGYAALAPDFYRGEIFAYDQMDAVRARLARLDDDALLADIDVAAAALQARPDVDAARLGIVGFCMGGRLAFLAACRRPQRYAVAASFYGGSIDPGTARDRYGRRAPIASADALQAPVLLVYGADDASIPAEEHGRIATRLSALRRRYALSVHPAAGHGFCCEDRPSHAPLAARAAFGELQLFFDKAFKDG